MNKNVKQTCLFDKCKVCLYKIKFRLLPDWFKLISIGWIAVAAIVALLFSDTVDKPYEYLGSSINISLFIFLFSKQKHEDEFSEQIRFKSFTYSFVAFVALSGAFSAVSINRVESSFIIDNLYFQVLVGVSMLMSLLYFYITLYKMKKEI